jgi:hypothetical protein
MVKKYKLKCFVCKEVFPSKTDVFRNKGYPYCESCYVDLDAPYDDGSWIPNAKDDQDMIDECNLFRYGEC